MTYIRTFIGAVLMATAVLAQAPLPTLPAPPARPAPAAVPIVTPAPVFTPFDYTDQRQLADLQLTIEKVQAVALDAQAWANDAKLYAQADLTRAKAGVPGVAPRPAISLAGGYAFGNDEGTYQAGQRALDNHQWDQALTYFGRVTTGSRADGALYWKAYTLNKLNRRDEAQAAIADLRKTYAGSRWLEDASALELQIRQAAGQNVAPESESDEDLKLLALNSLMQSDPDRALPLIEGLLKGTQSPKLKKNAVYVLAQSNSARARTLLEQIARGGNNPDLQLTAISYLTAQRRGQSNSGDLLWEIYNSSNDISVKRQILNSFSASNDRDHLLQVAKNEKASDLRLAAIQHLGGSTFSAELLEIARTEKDASVRRAAIQQLASTNTNGDALVALYASEQDSNIRQTIVDTLGSRNNAKALVSLARSERDPQLQRRIVQRLGTMKSQEATDYLLELLNK